MQQKWIENDLKNVNDIPVKYRKDLDGSAIVQRFIFINQHSQTLSGLFLDPRFNGLLELAGDGARLGTEEKDGMVFNHYINSPESKFTKNGLAYRRT